MRFLIYLIYFIMSCFNMGYCKQMLPKDFVYLQDIAPSIKQEIKYYTNDNFTGRPIPGYKNPVCILTRPTAEALLKVEQELNQTGLGLKVFDGYRPQTAVNEFVRWSQDKDDQIMKANFYPNVNKADFFKLRYVAEQSGHTRGSTVDLTIIELKTQKELDMGTHFDFMDELSHPFNPAVGPTPSHNRQLLNQIMSKHGFIPLGPEDTEWWHFTLKDEPFPTTYFNFPVSIQVNSSP